jgi:hypothetical protein
MESPPALPSGSELLALERQSRAGGSGVGPAELVGCWRLEQLWSKAEAKPLGATAAMLRQLQASLTIAVVDESPAAERGPLFSVQNSVQLGPIQLRFRGHGSLRGKRPLLEFWFEELELRLGPRSIWRQPIQRQPQPKRRPFFALIASQPNWLAARGRGGGLALWLRSAS